MNGPEWQYDEFACAGIDYASREEVAAYDAMHRTFRDYAAATAQIVARLGLGRESTVIDLGSGTGAFTLHAAPVCRHIHAVDISRAMLDYCRAQADGAGLTNISYHHAGLLTYEHAGEPADAAVCVAALHHLPDFWKQRALQRVAGMLRPGGKFFLFDIVFPAAAADLDAQIGQWLAGIGRMANARLAGEALVHVRDEHSTYDWVMEGMLARAGFTLAAKEYAPGFQTTYLGII
ncbi:MAG TPA: methyltransferase domain-containing protein [bacterium]|nr:methyltransferase domain-containing protein [bacterium]